MPFPTVVQQVHFPKISEHLFRCTIWIAGAMVIGTLGYCVVEGWSISEGFYMTMITFSTVGYGEINQLSAVGRIYTSGLIFLSIILMACWTAGITTTYVSGELSGNYREQRIRKMIQKLKGHTIVFGSGIMAESVIDQLDRADKQWVLVDENKEGLAKIRKHFPNAMLIESSPKNELALADANIFSASSVISVLESDFDNLLVAMTVKELSDKIKVYTRSDDPRISSRMLKVGVDHVVCPFQLSGNHIADFVISEKNAELV